jgi:hypothetical protein
LVLFQIEKEQNEVDSEGTLPQSPSNAQLEELSSNTQGVLL